VLDREFKCRLDYAKLSVDVTNCFLDYVGHLTPGTCAVFLYSAVSGLKDSNDHNVEPDPLD